MVGGPPSTIMASPARTWRCVTAAATRASWSRAQRLERLDSGEEVGDLLEALAVGDGFLLLWSGAFVLPTPSISATDRGID